MSKRKTNPSIILLSDSEDEPDEQSDESAEEEEEEEDGDTSNSSASGDESEWSAEEEEDDEADIESIEEEEEEEEEESDDSGESATPYDDQSGYNRVLDRLKGRRDLEVLKMEECKAYLRKHGLRITGAKAVLVQRILEYWRIKDGNGEKLYPRSSFFINCTGDVCKGDVVVFTQRVYEKFDKMTRRGNHLGKRTVAGRVVKESYGAAKQQHTFTVEVLWTKGYKKLPPLFPLLVKGRNLYRLRTFRQRWDNEAERSKVLAEKHKRGAAARNIRAIKKARSSVKDSKRLRHTHQEIPPKRQKKEGHRQTTRSETRKGGGDGRGKAKTQRIATGGITKLAKPLQATRQKENVGVSTYATNPSSLVSNYSAQRQFHDPPLHYEEGSTSRHYMQREVRPELYPYHQGYNHLDPRHSGYHFDPRQMHAHNPNYRQLNLVPLGMETYRGFANNGCSTPGCGDRRAENCIVFSCWRCCKRRGRRCLVHH